MNEQSIVATAPVTETVKTPGVWRDKTYWHRQMRSKYVPGINVQGYNYGERVANAWERFKTLFPTKTNQ